MALPFSAGRNLSWDLFGGKVVRSLVLFGIVVCKDGGCLVNGRGFHSVGEAFHYILDKRV